MKKIISLILCLFLLLSLIPTNIAYSASSSLYVNESFNDYPTYMVPDAYDITCDNYYIEEYEKGDKGLALFMSKTPAKVGFALAGGNNIAVSFGIKYTNNPITGAMSLIDSSGNAIKLINFNTDNRVTAYNGYPIGGYSKSTLVTYAVEYNSVKNTCNIYCNGREVSSSMKINAKALSAITKLQFEFVSPSGGECVILDDINVSDTHMKKYPIAEFETAVESKPDVRFEKKVGTNILCNADFEELVPFNISLNYGNIIEQRKEENGNTAMYFERVNTGDFHLTNPNVEAYESDCIVYQFDFKTLDEASVFNLALKDNDGNVPAFASLAPGPAFVYHGRRENLEVGKWYNFAIMVDLFNRTVDYYFNGVKTSTSDLTPGFAFGCVVDTVRIHATIYGLGGTIAKNTDTVKFMIDNFKVYEGDEPREISGDVERVVRITDKTIFPSEYMEKKLLTDCYAIHTRSGVVYDGSKKTHMKNMPYAQNGTVMVNADELDSILNEKSGLTGDVSIDSYSSALKRVITKDTTCINSGLAVLSKTSYKMPEDATMMQKLNDYVYNLRPSPEAVMEAYKESPNYQKHPRIQASAEDFSKLRNEIKTDEIKKLWASRVIATADGSIGASPIKYELRDGVRLLSVSREMLFNMYTLGMAYQLTGDKKYADQAWVHLNAVCSVFPDWHPIHDIDLGEMSAAVAIGYDWMYDAFTDEQRKIMQNGIYQNCLCDGAMGFQSKNAPMGGYALMPDNHNVVSNGGMSMLSLAFLDTYPTECSYIISNAIRAVDNMFYKFAPDGAWYEGPHYWEYTMQYTAKMISTLDSALGTSFGLDTCEGFDTSADFMLYMQSSQGIFNYGDGIQMSVYPPELLWLSKKYGNKAIATKLLELIDNTFSDSEAHVLALLWYDVNNGNAGAELSVDRLYSGENTLVMRNNWKDKESSFVGVHAGESNISHSQLDGGSFIFDYANIRWAKDLGMGTYNNLGYWDTEGDDAMRWKYFFSRAESHNTLVVNPGVLSDHYSDSFAPLTLVSSKARGAIATVDMTELLHDVSLAKRGFMYTDNRRSLVVRDEINLQKESDVYWFMITDAVVSCDESGATLVQNGRSLRLDFVSSEKAEISCAQAQPLPVGPHPDNDNTTKSNRIMIHFKGNGKATLTVKLTPDDVDGTPISSYDTDISTWYVPDGDIPVPPTLSSVSINGEELNVESQNIIYQYVEGTLNSTPEIIVPDGNYYVTLESSSSLDETSRIILTDKSDPSNKAVYSVIFKMIPLPREFYGMKSLPVYSVSVSEEPQPENGAMNLVDNDLSTRWSAEGIGHYVILDLKNVNNLDKLALACYSGDTRSTRLKINVSEDGYSYTRVFEGLSSGTTSDFEFYDLKGLPARYVKIECDGNTEQTAGGWNSLSEIVVTMVQ